MSRRRVCRRLALSIISGESRRRIFAELGFEFRAYRWLWLGHVILIDQAQRLIIFASRMASKQLFESCWRTPNAQLWITFDIENCDAVIFPELIQDEPVANLAVFNVGPDQLHPFALFEIPRKKSFRQGHFCHCKEKTMQGKRTFSHIGFLHFSQLLIHCFIVHKFR